MILGLFQGKSHLEMEVMSGGNPHLWKPGSIQPGAWTPRLGTKSFAATQQSLEGLQDISTEKWLKNGCHFNDDLRMKTPQQGIFQAMFDYWYTVQSRNSKSIRIPSSVEFSW